jgi:hypothetical protein
MYHPKSAFFLLLLTILFLFILTLFGPEEKSLGSNVRVVYLHGAWVLTALLAFVGAGATGLIALITRHASLHRWSQALGRTGLVFWLTYLPLSLWAMQTNWNGLFLTEPRWRLAAIFAVTGLLLQIGLSLIDNLAWTSAGNLGFLIALALGLFRVDSVMHPPPSPIFNSGLWHIQLFFVALNLLTLLAAWQVANWWYSRGRLQKTTI